MKVPLSWLRDYVDVDIPVKALSDLLTFSGVEVEGIEQVGPVMDGVVVGDVLTKARHPNADRLWVCTVNDGSTIRPVVCGADNFEAGDKAAFAPAGVTLPNGLTLKKAKIRGEVSEGMLCAPDELGLSDDHSGVLKFERTAVTGAPASGLIPGAETVLDLEITWNRPDCLSIIGIAREVAALLGKPLKVPNPAPPEVTGEAPAIQIGAPELCGRYTGRRFDGIKLGPSPDWMQKRLIWSGIRPINNVVDITNYVMLECGQPLHAFDFDLLEGGVILVRRATISDAMATLDGIKRELNTDTLVIADSKRPVALAGIMGGAGSEIRENTTRVLLESAVFDSPSIKRSATRLGLATESSRRFERGVDPESVAWASARAAALLIELAGAVPVGPVTDLYPGRRPLRRISCRFDRVRSLLGMPVTNSEILAVFQGLGLRSLEPTGRDAVIEIPSFRPDLEREADLIEEVARMRGLDQVPESAPLVRVMPGPDQRPVDAVARIRHQLAALGLMEVYHYSFLSPRLMDRFDVPETVRVMLPNPVTADHSVMRSTLIPQMVETLGRNHSREVSQAALFELGKVFLPGEGAVSAREELRLSIGMIGPVGRSGQMGRRDVTGSEMFGWVKGVVEAILDLNRCVDVTFEAGDLPGMEAGAGAVVKAGSTRLGVVGLIRTDIRMEWRITSPVGVVELDCTALVAAGPDVPQARALPAFPSVARDVAMWVDAGVTHEAIVKTIRRAASAELTAVDLFDIYAGKGANVGRKSMAYSLRYQSRERTLTDEEANRFHDAIKQALKQELGAVMREG